jgi:exodeoxyribonuclease-3
MLDWLGRLRKTLGETARPEERVVLGGDFDFAREPRDVFDPQLMEGKIHFSPPEHEALDRVLQFGLEDTFRLEEGDPGHYSWWDYRMGAFRRNRGLRIDYLFASKSVTDTLRVAAIDKTPRSWEKPSDHAPVVIEFD